MIKSAFTFLLSFVLYMIWGQIMELYPSVEKGKYVFLAILIVATLVTAVMLIAPPILKCSGRHTVGLLSMGLYTAIFAAFFTAMKLSEDAYPFLKSYTVYALIAMIIAIAVFIIYTVVTLIFAIKKK